MRSWLRIFNLLYHTYSFVNNLKKTVRWWSCRRGWQTFRRSCVSKSRGRENMKKLSGVLEGLGSQVKQHQWRLAHRSTARWDQCALVCRLMSVHTFTCMWNNGFSSCLPSSPSPLISLSFPLFFSYMYPPLPPLPPSLPSPASPLLSPVLAFPLLSLPLSSSSPLFLHLLSSSPPTHSITLLRC